MHDVHVFVELLQFIMIKIENNHRSETCSIITYIALFVNVPKLLDLQGMGSEARTGPLREFIQIDNR